MGDARSCPGSPHRRGITCHPRGPGGCWVHPHGLDGITHASEMRQHPPHPTACLAAGVRTAVRSASSNARPLTALSHAGTRGPGGGSAAARVPSPRSSWQGGCRGKGAALPGASHIHPGCLNLPPAGLSSGRLCTARPWAPAGTLRWGTSPAAGIPAALRTAGRGGRCRVSQGAPRNSRRQLFPGRPRGSGN